MTGDDRAAWFVDCVHPDLAVTISHFIATDAKNMNDPTVATTEIRRLAEMHETTQARMAPQARNHALAAIADALPENIPDGANAIAMLAAANGFVPAGGGGGRGNGNGNGNGGRGGKGGRGNGGRAG